MARIRCFEELVLEEFTRGIFSGTTHTYIGQEANAAALFASLQPDDLVFSNHRCHGHFLAYGGSPFGLFAELMGKQAGLVGGRGGSQHIHWKNFYSNGVLGSTIPVAVGAALSEKRLKRPSVTLAFLGDGALGEGAVYEAFNIASLWQIPILFVVENNHIAQTTPTSAALAGSLSARFSAFNIPVVELDSSDVLEILPVGKNLIDQVRQTLTPGALILNTERFGPHSKGDDTRPDEALKQLRQRRDPLTIHGQRLSPQLQQDINQSIRDEIRRAFNQAMEET